MVIATLGLGSTTLTTLGYGYVSEKEADEDVRPRQLLSQNRGRSGRRKLYEYDVETRPPPELWSVVVELLSVNGAGRDAPLIERVQSYFDPAVQHSLSVSRPHVVHKKDDGEILIRVKFLGNPKN